MPTLKGGGGLYSPHISLISGKSAVNIYSASSETFTCTFSEDGKLVPPTTGQPNDEIWYTSTDGEIVQPYDYNEGEPIPIETGQGEDLFGANIVSNSYTTNGKGIIKFDGDVTMIGKNAFDGYECGGANLKTMSIPESVIKIDENAFYCCENLISIILPNSITTFEEAFDECLNLPVQDNVRYTSLDVSHNPCAVGVVDDELTSYTILSGTKYLVSIFCSCNQLTDVIIPDTVIHIGYMALSFCSKLISITIPNSVTYIGESAFNSCSNLTNITIPNSVISIGKNSFQSCNRSLTTITIPESVVKIDDFAFNRCSKLSTVYCNAIVPPTLGSNAFTMNSLSGRLIYVPSGSVDTYKAASNWSTYASDIVAQS